MALGAMCATFFGAARQPAGAVISRRFDRSSEAAQQPLATPAESLLWMDMRNVDLHIDVRNVMRVRSLRGQVVSTHSDSIPWLDVPTSFHIRATSGSVALDGNAVAALLNEIAFAYPGAPLRDLKV